MRVLVDTSVWVDYFRDGRRSSGLEALLGENLIVTNEFILTELVPFLAVRKQKKLISLLDLLPILPLRIDWNNICALQTACLKKGLTGIGIPDLILAQHILENELALYTIDNHFKQLRAILSLELYEPAK